MFGSFRSALTIISSQQPEGTNTGRLHYKNHVNSNNQTVLNRACKRRRAQTMTKFTQVFIYYCCYHDCLKYCPCSLKNFMLIANVFASEVARNYCSAFANKFHIYMLLFLIVSPRDLLQFLNLVPCGCSYGSF